MSDLISRQAALNQITAIDTSIIPYVRAREYVDELKNYVVKIIETLPSAEPEPEEFEWCHDCKEYDQDKHCCHRWTKVIRQTVEDMKNRWQWTPVTEALPKVRTDVLLAFEKNMAVGFYSYGCWNVNTGNGFYTGVFTDEDKPIAWMPLPEPAKIRE